MKKDDAADLHQDEVADAAAERAGYDRRRSEHEVEQRPERQGMADRMRPGSPSAFTAFADGTGF